MSIKIQNKDNQLTISNISGNGIVISDNNSKLDKVNKIDTIDSLPILITTNYISVLQEQINNLQLSVETLKTIVAGLQTENYTVQSYVLDFSINNTFTEFTNAGAPNVIDIACSGDGKYIFVCPWSVGSAQFSTNYGETWTTPSNISTLIWSCSMNLDGKYIIVSDLFNYKISTDYGQTFTSPYPRPLQLYRSALSASGKYIVCGCGSGNGLQVSTDYGSTWTQRETSVWTWNDVAISLNGSVIYGASDSGLIKKSTDHGQTWTTIYTDSSSKSIKSMSCSNDGQYILAAFNSAFQLLLSTDHGATFNLVGTSASYYKVAIDKNGINMIASVNGFGLHYSSNSGSSWTYLANNKICAIAMTYGGDYIYNVSPYNKPSRIINTSLIV